MWTWLLTLSTFAVAPQAPPRYLALGDSYTIGESVAAPMRWPNQLAQALRAAGVPLAEPEIFARTGWTTDELSASLDARESGSELLVTPTEQAPLLDPPYQLVSLQIGVNNQYRGRSAADFRAQFPPLLARALAYAGGDTQRVLVLSIPDWGVTPFAQDRDAAAIAREIDAYNQVAHDACERAGIRFIDITPLTREAKQRPELLADDGLHPSGLDYARWAQAAFATARAALERPATR